MASKSKPSAKNTAAVDGNSGSSVRCAIYARVSTPDQHVEVQVSELRALAEVRGWDVVETFTDVGISGVKASRPGLDALLR